MGVWISLMVRNEISLFMNVKSSMSLFGPGPFGMGAVLDMSLSQICRKWLVSTPSFQALTPLLLLFGSARVLFCTNHHKYSALISTN